MKKLLRKKDGFTLIELMIVVAIIGILAAIALPQFLNYVKRSKTSEATNQLKGLYTNVATYYGQERGGGTLGSTTSGSCIVDSTNGGAPYPDIATVSSQKLTTDWSQDPTFKALGFSISDPHFFTYAVDTQITASCGIGTALAPAGTPIYVLSAHADLDDDDTYSTFSMEVGLNAQAELTRAPSFEIQNELE